MEEKLRDYFEECAKSGREATAPGLCLTLGVSLEELAELSERESAVRDAIYRIADCLEQRHDSNAKFLLRQPIYGGYSDSAEDRSPVTVKVLLDEEKTKEESEN